MTERVKLLGGDALTVLRTLPSESVQEVVTSPPYWNLRNYGAAGQIGLERTLQAYVGRLTGVFAEARRVLKRDGVMWLNLGDTHCGDEARHSGLRKKQLAGVPWRVAFALQESGWILRADCIWHKPNAQPESIRDRPTICHEYLFLFAKSPRYYYDQDAIREPLAEATLKDKRTFRRMSNRDTDGMKLGGRRIYHPLGRNKRTVWTVPTRPTSHQHFAVFPAELIRPCIKSGSRIDDVVLDPFCGSGTTGIVAMEESRQFLGIEINPDYLRLAQKQLGL